MCLRKTTVLSVAFGSLVNWSIGIMNFKYIPLKNCKSVNGGLGSSILKPKFASWVTLIGDQGLVLCQQCSKSSSAMQIILHSKRLKVYICSLWKYYTQYFSLWIKAYDQAKTLQEWTSLINLSCSCNTFHGCLITWPNIFLCYEVVHAFTVWALGSSGRLREENRHDSFHFLCTLSQKAKKVQSCTHLLCFQVPQTRALLAPGS